MRPSMGWIKAALETLRIDSTSENVKKRHPKPSAWKMETQLYKKLSARIRTSIGTIKGVAQKSEYIGNPASTNVHGALNIESAEPLGSIFRISITWAHQIRPVRDAQGTRTLSDTPCFGLRDDALAANPCRFPRRGLDHKAALHDIFFLRNHFPGTYGHSWPMSVEGNCYILLPFIAPFHVSEGALGINDRFRMPLLIFLLLAVFSFRCATSSHFFRAAVKLFAHLYHAPQPGLLLLFAYPYPIGLFFTEKDSAEFLN